MLNIIELSPSEKYKYINKNIYNNAISNEKTINSIESNNSQIDYILDNTNENEINNINLELIIKNKTKKEIIIWNKNTGINNTNQININIKLEEYSDFSIYFIDQNNKNNQNHIINQNYELASNSNLNIYNIIQDNNIYKNTINININGEECKAQCYGVGIAKSNTNIHNHISINHKAPNSYSNQYYKTILFDEAVAEFTGAINVSQIAQNTDAFQMSRNMLMSDKTIAYTRPQLQIYADNVKCSHGASTGQLNNEQLIYFQARGINIEQAKLILIQSFVDEIIEKIENSNIKTYLKSNFFIDYN